MKIRKREKIPLRKFKKNLLSLGCFVLRAALGAAICFLGVYAVFGLAKSGSDFFYYAMAFASPGSAAEFLSTPFPDDEALFEKTEEEGEDIAQSPEQEEEILQFVPEISGEIPEERRGKVTEIQYSAKEGGIYIAHKNAIIKNCTKLSTEKIKKMLIEEHSLSLSTGVSSEPQVLIYHTHATEGFEPRDSGFFDISGTWRSTDPDRNMIAVGDAMTSVLTKKGIGVIHSGTMHDDPGYKGSYQRSAKTIRGILSENPGIVICLDLHRDAIEPSEKEIMKPTVLINGRKAAQIMIISGCDDGSMNMPDYAENLRFAAALGSKLEELYPGICRPILFDYRKYNMNLSPGLLLIEIGATGNTLEEAKYSAELLGNALSELFAE